LFVFSHLKTAYPGNTQAATARKMRVKYNHPLVQIIPMPWVRKRLVNQTQGWPLNIPVILFLPFLPPALCKVAVHTYQCGGQASAKRKQTFIS